LTVQNGESGNPDLVEVVRDTRFQVLKFAILAGLKKYSGVSLTVYSKKFVYLKIIYIFATR